MATVGSTVNLYLLYRIVKDLSTPFNETDAFKAGLIDDKGKKLKKAESKEEKEASSYYNRFILNIKRMLSKVGLGSKLATFAAALFLIKEEQERNHILTEESFKDEDAVLEEIVRNIRYLEENSQKNYNQLVEDAPANSTGAAVAGTGDDGVTWVKKPYRVGVKGERKRKGRYINGVTFLKKMARESDKKSKE
jgi:hypothetical protein